MSHIDADETAPLHDDSDDVSDALPVLDITLPESFNGKRLDVALAALLPDYSRSRIQQWIKQGHARLDAQTVDPKHKLVGGEHARVYAITETEVSVEPEPIALDVRHADDDLIVINKSAGLVVHPGAGNRHGTLVNGLIHQFPELKQMPRAGLVHRLDKNTTGLLVVARNLTAHKVLVDALKAHEIERVYQALVCGVMTGGGNVDAPLGRHPTQRTRMAVNHTGRPARTHYRIIERFDAHTLLQVRLETGRTHQIRVHMAHIGHPLVGDPMYGGRPRFPAAARDDVRQALQSYKRQALHACALRLRHPRSRDWVEFDAPNPKDLQNLVDLLR